MRGERLRRDAEAASGQRRACQRAEDLWDVRAAWAELAQEEPTALVVGGEGTPILVSVIVPNPERELIWGWAGRTSPGFPGLEEGRCRPRSPPAFSLPTPNL